MQLIRVYRHGGPEVMQLEEAPVPTPGPGQVLVKLEAIGVNYIEIYIRTGLYRRDLPLVPGNEGAGTVEAVGPEVRGVQEGDRVAWATEPGSYAQYQLVPASALVAIPEGLSFQQSAAVMVQGLTAHYLAVSTYPVGSKDTCLVHAAAGGLGQLLCQIARMRGARVIGTAGSPEKAAIAHEAGADEVILYRERDFAAATREFTGGAGVQVVYDMVGKDTFEGSLNSLARRGYLVLVGQASGPVPPLDPQLLNARGSLFLTRPTLGDYLATREDLLWRAGEVLQWLKAGKLRVRIDRVYPLAQAAEAHRALAARETAGKVLLTP